MLFEKEYRERCATRGLDEAGISRAIESVGALEAETEMARAGLALASSPLALVEAHVAKLVARDEATDERILALARYFAVSGGLGAIGAEAIAIRLLAYLLPVGVLPSMAKRLAELEGNAVRDRVMAKVVVPPQGSPPEAYPVATKAFASALEAELGAQKARRVLAWNVHGIPAAAFAEERERFLAAPSIEAWLVGFHTRQVAVLEKHAKEGTLWFEQKITPRVVEFVRESPEILGGVRIGDHIFATKIPYDPDRWLVSEDPLERRRLACHCPLAASTIGAKDAKVPPIWCACSAGFEKFMFDMVFGEETECEVLESVLDGSGRCRFSISIPESVLRAK